MADETGHQTSAAIVKSKVPKAISTAPSEAEDDPEDHVGLVFDYPPATV